jgi:hypothetical protein
MPTQNLSVGSFGDEVRDLHSKLRHHGLDLPGGEVERGFFGPATREAVRQCQREHGLKMTGVVDPTTYAALDAAVANRIHKPAVARGGISRESAGRRIATSPTPTSSQPPSGGGEIPEEENRIVRGHVVYKDGLLIEGVTVRAYNKDLGHEDLLGEAVTEQEGRYEIKYSAAQFSRPNKKYADLVLRVYDFRAANGRSKEEIDKPLVEPR